LAERREEPEPPSDGPPSGLAIETASLGRRFGDVAAVTDLDLRVRQGTVFGLLGPNGAGKTTTFRMLCGMLAPSGGTLRVAGVDLRHARASAGTSATSRSCSPRTGRSRRRRT
jgi:ABC-2 type transport system ATP-binding protein